MTAGLQVAEFRSHVEEMCQELDPSVYQSACGKAGLIKRYVT